MKTPYLLFSLLLFACGTNTSTNLEPTDETDTIPSAVETPQYDSVLAHQYGADTYGMKPYVIAFLKTGPNPPKDSAHAVELQAAHMANIGRLAEEGKLVLAGPFYGDAKGDLRGIYVFDTANLDSAKSFTQSDPAIQYGSLSMELVNWYGSAAVMGIPEVHDRIAKENP